MPHTSSQCIGKFLMLMRRSIVFCVVGAFEASVFITNSRQNPFAWPFLPKVPSFQQPIQTFHIAIPGC